MLNNALPHEKLTALLKPYIEPLVKLRLKEQEKNMPLGRRFRIDATMFCLGLFAKCAWIKAWLANKDFRRNPTVPFINKKSSKLQADRECDDMEVDKTSDGIICFWFEILAFSARDHNDKLVLSELDDAMLPKQAPSILKDESVDQLISEFSAGYVIFAKDVRGILRAVRQSLPAGRILPEAMIDYLKSAGITVEKGE